ncbi:MAG: hypothetical protein KC544_13280 [Gemmatimonadetes bacterium]|nr:hypothetical protein [Gemmatimonadota bacterium]
MASLHPLRSRRLGVLVALLLVPTLAARAQAPARLDPARLVPHIYSLAAVANGQRVGWWRYEITRLADGWRYEDRTQLGARLDQRTTILLDGEGRIRSVEQRARMGEDSLTADAAWTDTRVTGESRTPGPTPHRTFDLPITPATIDDNFLAAVLPTLDWAVGDTLVLEVMSTGQGTVTPMALTVERGDTIEVDGRAVPVWVGTMTGGPLPVQYVVSRDRPRRVHRIAPIGSPLAFERVAG